MNKRLILFFSIVVIVVSLFWYSSIIQDEFYIVVDFFSKLVIQNEALAVFVFIFLAVLSALVSPLTSIPLVPIAVVIWGGIPTTIFLLSGWLIGDTIAYLIGRYLGYKTVCYFVSSEKIDKVIGAIKKHTSFSKGLLLRLILPAELGYAFGIIRYEIGPYLLLTFLAELPFAIISTYASEVVIAGDVVKSLGLMVIFIIAIFITFRVIRNKPVAS